MQYINLGSCVTAPAGVTLDNSPIAMRRLQALSGKVRNRTARIPCTLCRRFTSSCLFYLSPFSYLRLTPGS